MVDSTMTASAPGEASAQTGAELPVFAKLVPFTVPTLAQPNGSSVVTLDPTPTPPSLLNIESDFEAARNATSVADNAVVAAQGFIAQLGTLVGSFVPPTITPQYPNLPSAPAITSPTAPTLITATYNPPGLPAAFAGQVPGINQFPTFTAIEPSLLFPNAPAAPVLNVPASPSVDLNFTYPTVNVDLPSIPSLLSISVETFDGVTFPTLSATAPTLTAVAPSVIQYVPSAPYTDALLQSLTASLKQRIDIGNTGTNTGLPPAVEENIWNRGREREYRTQADSLAALERMESMGYAFPPGTFIDATIKVRTESDFLFVGQSRDIAVAQAQLEQTNIKTALETAVSIEGKLIDYANQTEQRRFEATKYATEAGVAIYNAAVQAFSANVQAYRAAIDVYTAQIAGAKAMVDIYTAEISAERLKVDINLALVQQYKIQVDAALASIEVFKGEIQIIQTEAQIEQLKVNIFGEQVRSYAAQAQLYATEVEGYKATIEAENAKEQVYATSANVYGTLVGAVSKQIDAGVQIYQAQLAAKKLEYDGFTAQVQSEAERVRAIAAQNTSVAAVYSATVQGSASYNDALVKEYQAAAQISEQIAQIGVSAAEASGKLYVAVAQIAADAAKVGAQVEAQIAASGLGAVTYATHRARQDSVGYSQSLSFSQSKSLGQSSSSTLGASTSVSYGTSTSLSASASGSESFTNNTNIAEAQ